MNSVVKNNTPSSMAKFLSLIVMSVLMLSCSSKSELEKKYLDLIKRELKQDARYIKINRFRQEHVLEKTEQQKVVLVRYYVELKKPKKYSNPRVGQQLKYFRNGMVRKILVLKKDHGQWKIVDDEWSTVARKPLNYGRSDYTFRLTAYSGYWQYFDVKTPKVKLFTVVNPAAIKPAHPERARHLMQTAATGGNPSCLDLPRHKATPRIRKIRPQQAIILPQAKTVRLLLTSMDVIYGFDLLYPRAQSTAVPGFMAVIYLDAQTPGIRKIWFYRACGNDIEYGVIPLKIVPVKEYQIHIKGNQK